MAPPGVPPVELSGPDVADNSRIGRRIRQARVRSGISLRTLAERLGVSPATMSQVETGKTGLSVRRLARIAEALDVAVGDLVPAPARSISSTPIRPVPGPGPDAAHLRKRADTIARVLAGIGPNWRAYQPLHLDPVLRAALAVFAERGYHGCSMRDIAAAADMSVPGLYHHYPSKQEMLVVLLDVAGAESFRRAELARDAGPGDTEPATARFCRLVESLALYNTHRLDFARVGVAERRSLAPENRERLTQVRRRIQSLLETEIRAGVATGEFATAAPGDAARAVAMLCTGLSNWFRPGGPIAAEDVAHTYTGFALGLVRISDTPVR
ncbi:TetR family transcriptional regulator [Pseudonocardia nematodicida]|uniref:TetR family transcriptional regulator n=1 Tax=Pseudonocardia nematodicida TaxID=1206997 RepID=A0ABV1KDW7_9PSEU